MPPLVRLMKNQIAVGKKINMRGVKCGVRAIAEGMPLVGNLEAEAWDEVFCMTDFDFHSQDGVTTTGAQYAQAEKVLKFHLADTLKFIICERAHGGFEPVFPDCPLNFGYGVYDGFFVAEEAAVKTERFKTVGVVAVKMGENHMVNVIESEGDAGFLRSGMEHHGQGVGTVHKDGSPIKEDDKTAVVIIFRKKIPYAKNQDG